MPTNPAELLPPPPPPPPPWHGGSSCRHDDRLNPADNVVAAAAAAAAARSILAVSTFSQASNASTPTTLQKTGATTPAGADRHPGTTSRAVRTGEGSTARRASRPGDTAVYSSRAELALPLQVACWMTCFPMCSTMGAEAAMVAAVVHKSRLLVPLAMAAAPLPVVGPRSCCWCARKTDSLSTITPPCNIQFRIKDSVLLIFQDFIDF
ncbi:hypothetical protein Vretimale_9879 [Volvox reticuliferus]|uniref:Uncharacterized protein n=1 Tax=Volvox reticuliferus TaxID=1737510 RepID=A0A8J4CN36_9CHLO|nr:hypothetical protein Vretifemale_13704 [Volvox reticuliferus]GIM05448.1 hypothetical protein Vretimale_9879 [Volvox reticuliferus]